jgi:hypothetical protein
MSWKALSIALEARIAPPTTKLGLVVLADFMNEKTGRLDPSLDTLAEKIGVSRDQARRIVRELSQRGLISVIANFTGGRPGTTQQYRLNFEAIAALIPEVSTDSPSRLGTKERARELAKILDRAAMSDANAIRRVVPMVAPAHADAC